MFNLKQKKSQREGPPFQWETRLAEFPLNGGLEDWDFYGTTASQIFALSLWEHFSWLYAYFDQFIIKMIVTNAFFFETFIEVAIQVLRF